jgi:aminoglycoside phosphotransferase (APT) family kinase protein
VSRGLEHENGSVDKTAITSALVSQLVERQFPQWADLPVSRVELDGWDNTTYRLGEEFSVRLPSADGYVPQVDKEHRWLPVLAPQLPVRIPEPVARGEPEPAFPRPWSVYRWLQGEHATVERIDDLELFAHNLSAFLAALYEIESASGPAAGQHSFFRGGPLATYDADTRTSITALADTIDTAAATQVWEAALATEWQHAPVWVHGDVGGSNLLVVDGRLSAVIDFGCSAVGDPACDLAIAWTFFFGDSREAFRDRLRMDRGTWARGRAWALWKALITLANDDAGAAAERFGWRIGSRQVIDEVLADHT